MEQKTANPIHFSNLPSWKRDWVLWWSYIKITTVVLGGGYAIISAVQQEFVNRRHWLNDDDVLEMMTVTQTVPGILAVNSAAFVGWKINGIQGAFFAVIGASIPSFVIISLIATGVKMVDDALNTPVAKGAFCGVIAGVTGMVINTAIQLQKKACNTMFAWCITILCFIGMVVMKYSPAFLILGAILLGWIKVTWELNRK